MTELRKGLPDLPARMRKLPVNHQGYPVPWFVSWIDGEPEFRVVEPGKINRAVRFKLCWLCGETMGSYAAFVIGPMCGINRISAEPPCHRECAEFAVRACPFLTLPAAKRRTAGLPDGCRDLPGEAIKRNPGVVLLWVTRQWQAIPVDHGLLFKVGDPTSTQWFREGREATLAEVRHSIDTGLPTLMEATGGDRREMMALTGALRDLQQYLPAA